MVRALAGDSTMTSLPTCFGLAARLLLRLDLPLAFAFDFGLARVDLRGARGAISGLGMPSWAAVLPMRKSAVPHSPH